MSGRNSRSAAVVLAAILAVTVSGAAQVEGIPPGLVPALVPAPVEMSVGEGWCPTGAAVTVEVVKKLPPEGYEISVATNGVTIRHGDGAGLFWANVTLGQIREQCGRMMPCLEIKDAPRFPCIPWLETCVSAYNCF